MATTQTLDIAILESDNGVIIRLKGDAGVSNADELDRRLLPIAARRPPLVVFDLTELVFVSSLGLGILLRFQQGLERHQCRVRYAGAPKAVRDMLKKCLLDRVLLQFDSLSEALDAKVEPTIGQ